MGRLFEDFADLAGMDLLQTVQLATNVDSMLGRLRSKYDFFGRLASLTLKLEEFSRWLYKDSLYSSTAT
jgi:hypothetical protein